jgi:hypothetical protein
MAAAMIRGDSSHDGDEPAAKRARGVTELVEDSERQEEEAKRLEAKRAYSKFPTKVWLAFKV